MQEKEAWNAEWRSRADYESLEWLLCTRVSTHKHDTVHPQF